MLYLTETSFPILLILTISKHMCLNTFYDESYPPMNTVQLMVYEVLMFHENTKLLPSGDSYDLSIGDIDPDERITLALVGIPVRNQLRWVKLDKKE